MIWQLLGVFAESEREMIRNRVVAGIERATSPVFGSAATRSEKAMKAEIPKLRGERMVYAKNRTNARHRNFASAKDLQRDRNS